MVKLCFAKDEISEVFEGLEIVARVRGFCLGDDGIKIKTEKISNGLCIEGKNNDYTISWNEKSDFFRAVSTLVGLIERGEKEVSRRETRKMKMCGAMIDCSRNAVPRVETVITLMGRMAAAGMNTAMLYTEDTYEIEEYPYFGYMRGRYTIAEICEMDKAARVLGIELMPCIQTLAHLKNTLRWSYAADMRDNEDILLIGEEKTYKFIEAMFRSLRDAYSSNKILIGMDEAHFVGRGKYYDLHGDSDRFELLSQHLTRVCEIAEKYGFEPIMWSDMFFRLASKTGGYFDLEAEMPADLHTKIPESISLAYWDYYNTDKAMYRSMIDKHFQLKRKTIFVGGAWRWCGMGPGYEMTFRTTSPALDVCNEKGLENIIATMWGDDGAEVDVLTMLGGIQLFAEYNYYETVEIEHLKSQLKLCMGYDLESFLALEIDNFSKIGGDSPFDPVSRQIMYQDVLCGLFDKNFEGLGFKEHYKAKYEALKDISEPGLENLFAYYRSLTKVLYEKAEIGIDIKRAYDRGDRTALTALIAELERLLADYCDMCDKFETLWNEQNKVFGFDVYDIRTGGVKARIQTAIRKLTAYVNGRLERIEELEAEKLPYLKTDNGVNYSEHGYARISNVVLMG